MVDLPVNDNHWIQIRVKQTDALIARGEFTPTAMIEKLDRLSPQERRERILTTLTALASTAT